MNEKLKEIIKKHKLTPEEINTSIDQLCSGGLGKITNVACMIALAEVLSEFELTAKRMEKEDENN